MVCVGRLLEASYDMKQTRAQVEAKFGLKVLLFR